MRPTLPPWAAVTPERLEHIERVATLVSDWADVMGIPDSERNRWLRAVWLHDALRDAPNEDLERWAPTTPGPPELRHGPASAARAKAEGEVDRGVLDAVRYHSIGLAEWDMVGRALYCADFLEPGRQFDAEWRAELAAKFPREPARVLREVARSRLVYTAQSRWPILTLVAAGGGIVALLWPRRERIEGHAFAIPSPDRRIVVEVLNGTGRQGLARVATRMLRRQGIDVVFLGNAEGPADSTRVIVRRGERDRAKVVAEALGSAAVTVARDTLRRVDASVILGGDFQPKGELHP